MAEKFYPTAKDDDKVVAKAPVKPKATTDAGSYKWDTTSDPPMLIGERPQAYPWEAEGLTPLERVEAEMSWIKDLLDSLNTQKEAEAKGEPKPIVVVVPLPTLGELSDRLTTLATQRDVLVHDAEVRKQNREVRRQKAEEEKADGVA